MILSILCCLSLDIALVSGSSPSDQIVQIPADMFKNPGETAKISCTHSIPDYDRVLWYKQSKLHEMTLLGYMLGDDGYPEKEINVNIDGSANKDKNSTLTVAELSPDSSAVYYCAARYGEGASEAYFGGGTRLTVLDGTPVTPPTVKILQPSEKECKDNTGKKKKTLVCVASGFYPDHVGVSWTRNDQKITDGVSTDAAAKRGKDNYYKITSRLTIPINDWLEPNIRFKCIVSFYNGTANIETDDVFTTKGVDNPGMTRAKYLKITQNAKLSYSALIVKSLLYAALVCLLVWKLQGKRGKQTK